MIGFLKNNFYRISNRKFNVIMALLMTMISISLAVYFTSKQEVKINIAMVTQSQEPAFQSKYVKYTVMKEEPPKYQLVLGKYDGVIIDRGSGNYDIETIRNDDFRKMLEELIDNPNSFVPHSKDVRGVGANIIGYLLMFVLMQCVLFMFTLAEDMELKQIERIATSPISFTRYLLSHFVCTFTLVFVPAIFILFLLKNFIGLNIGFSLLQYTALLAILCSFGTAFVMFINSLVKVADTASMMASSLAMLTTILSGSFYSFEKGNEVLGKIIWLLPQKSFLSFVEGLERGKMISQMLPQFLYVITIALLFFTFSIIKIKKDYVLRRD